MVAPHAVKLTRRVVGENIWLARSTEDQSSAELMRHGVYELRPQVFDTEEMVGHGLIAELERLADEKRGALTIALLGGRGAQALHRLLGLRAQAGDPDKLISRLHVFTQDAIAPLKMNNSFSFVRDFERLLGAEFFRRVKSFTPMQTEVANLTELEQQLVSYTQQLEALGGLDIFFLGHGPEADSASHLAYIKPNAGATAFDVAGMIPISPSILEHHVAKFKAGGSHVNSEDEQECRAASHILTLGPAAILNAKLLVQSVVDADTSPAKRASYRRVMETEIADTPAERARQLNENPGLWVRLHPHVKSFILPNVLT